MNEIEEKHNTNLNILQENPIELSKIMKTIQPNQIVLDRLATDTQFENFIVFWNLLFGKLIEANTKKHTECSVISFHICHCNYSVKRIDNDFFLMNNDLKILWKIEGKLNAINNFLQAFPNYTFCKKQESKENGEIR